jgi:tetratricopeptide (TPR) repeat protein
MQKIANKLSSEEAAALKTIAVFNAPIHAQHLTDMGINRKMRAALLASGILEQTPSQNNRRYYAHELIHSVYKREEIFNYETLEELAERQMERSKDNSAKFNKDNHNPLLELAYLQEANALFWSARKRKRIWRTPLSCVDAIVSTAAELAGRKSTGKTDFGHIADLQIKDGLQMAPNHPELLFLEAKRALHDKEKRKQLEKIFAERRSNAMMPKFILEESKMLAGRHPEKAIKVLQEGLETLGNVEEIWFTLADILNSQGHAQAALQTVDKAIELHPTSPTYHSLRGDLLAKMGSDHFEAASEALAKASELYSGNAPAVHIIREIDMLRKRAMLDVDGKATLLTTAKERLESVLSKDANNLSVQVALAGILLDLESEDYAQIDTLLSAALKKRDNSDAHLYKARLLIRQNNLIDVEGNLDRAFKLSRNNSAINTVRGEYYLITGNPVLGLKAFQSALDASAKDSPEYAQIKRYVEQVTAILAAQANVNYAAIGEDSINVVSETVTERPAVMIRKKGKPAE